MPSINGKPVSQACAIKLEHRGKCPACDYNFASGAHEHNKEINCPNCGALLLMVLPKD